jgi:aarF domain-containing kinase
MEGDFVNTVLSILLLEGIGRQLDPNMDLFKSALPILRQLGRQMGGTVSAREAFEEAKKADLGAMLKIWVWMEGQSFASFFDSNPSLPVRGRDADA